MYINNVIYFFLEKIVEFIIEIEKKFLVVCIGGE